MPVQRDQLAAITFSFSEERTVIVVGHHLQDLSFAHQVLHLGSGGGVRVERVSRASLRPAGDPDERVQGGP